MVVFIPIALRVLECSIPYSAGKISYINLNLDRAGTHFSGKYARTCNPFHESCLKYSLHFPETNSGNCIRF